MTATSTAKKAENPVKFNDVTARDSHQSLWATRMRIADVLKIVKINAKAGFNALEVWGGATFDVSLRFLGEDPWDNLRQIKQAVKESAAEAGVAETPLMMLLRGQSLVGYKNYPDDIVRAFVRKSAENGMNTFRIFDGLNDTANLQTAVEEVKACQDEGMDVQAQGTVCYTTGPVIDSANDNEPESLSSLQSQKIFNLDYYLEKARELKEMGCDSICLKDMAGLMTPDVAAELIPAIQKETGLSVVLHMHAGMGLSDATIMSAVKAGVDEVDVGNAGLASGSGHSSIQMIYDMMKRSEDPDIQGRMPKVANNIFKTAREFLLSIRPKYAQWETSYNPEVQEKIWKAQIPGGMLSNFEGQIKSQIAGMDISYDEALKKVLDEVPRVREDLGWPPLVTPCSQIVGVQSVLNVLSDLRGKERYDNMPNETVQLLLGELGKTPVPANEELVQLAEEKVNRKRITGRPADYLEDGFSRAAALLKKKGLDHENVENVITVALWDDKGLSAIENKNTPEETATYEPEPQLPNHRVIKSWKKGSVAFGDVHDAMGSHVIEAIAQTAKEINRIEDGFFQYLPQEELDHRTQKYRGYIAKQLAEIPDRLQGAGLRKYQIEFLLVGSKLQTFNQIIRKRCVDLGVKPDSIPQISDMELRRNFEQSATAPAPGSQARHQPGMTAE